MIICAIFNCCLALVTVTFLFLIENDPYEQCAGDALEKCVTQDVNFEHDVDLKKEEYSYDACMKKQAETCRGAMMRHLMKQVEAEKEHVKKLIGLEELEGKKVLH